ncbi:MAG: helicase [Gloeocapsa sp. DLM2.Bin57]|nr:MAG: helicase [Gloeocapsa sp. DLM2.Bin57]
MNQIKSQLRDDQGRLFEVGFNSGILAYLHQQQIKTPWVDFYRPDLEQLQLTKLVNKLIERSQTISTVNKKIITRWSQLILLRGFLGGLSFVREYLESQSWNRFELIEVLYFQCSFCDDNSLNTHSKGDYSLSSSILNEFSQNVKNLAKNLEEVDINRYLEKGEFLKADTLILWRYRKEYRLLVVDASLFSLDATQDLTNPEFIELTKKKLMREMGYIRSKSIFNRLSIDTGEREDLSYAFTPKMKDYFRAFKVENKNKESIKLIQAGSYAYSFYQFLLKQQIIEKESRIIMTAIGYSDRGISSLVVTPENIDILKNCHEIYKQDYSKVEIQEARERVFNLIRLQINKSFDQGKTFVNQLLSISPRQTAAFSHQERLSNFANTAANISFELAQSLSLGDNSSLSLRNAHAELITQSLTSEANYLFLTGNPGIGKTTAVVKFLKEHIPEGFLFLYISPRIQVNKDIIEKFKDKESGKLYDDRLFCLSSHSQLINNYGALRYQHIVNYIAEKYPENFSRKSVQFLNFTQEDSPINSSSKIKRQNENTLRVVNQGKPGVLASIANAIYTLIDEEISNQIVATTSLQSLRETYNGKTTLEHLNLIFQSAYNSSQNCVIPQNMRQISRRIKHIFIMIDEITGSENGAAFLKGISDFTKRYQLCNPEYGFNTKIIVADASIVEQSVINQHLSTINPEPDKIFFRKATTTPQALTINNFCFQKKPAIIINANSYPANNLDLTYRVFVEAKEFDAEKQDLKRDDGKLLHELESSILQDIHSLSEEDGQILIYIQDKQKLQTILDKLNAVRSKPLEKNKDYLEVRSNLSEREKKELHQYKEDQKIKLIFMTSAGSRGLSFPYVKHILVVIPTFQVEQNIMEILQVIYRGRGKEEIDKQDKQIIFYLAEKAIYYPDTDEELARQETLLNILNTLLIIKVAMMTRIKGAGNLGKQAIVLIPIGGKSTVAAGATFSSKINNLLDLLYQEYRLNPSHKILKETHQQLQELLSKTHFSLSPPQEANSYLGSLGTFSDNFTSAINDNFAELLSFGNLEKSYIVGGLIIVPTKEKPLAKQYHLRLAKIIQTNSSQLLKSLQAIKLNQEQYNINLRYATQDAIHLIEEIQTEMNNSQNLQETSNYLDQYYAFPLFTLLSLEILSEYLETEDDEETSFKRVLLIYIKSLHNVYDILPIGYKYQDFPFILFRSYSLEKMRQQLFTQNYLFNSTELNIVNLIQSQE